MGLYLLCLARQQLIGVSNVPNATAAVPHPPTAAFMSQLVPVSLVDPLLAMANGTVNANRPTVVQSHAAGNWQANNAAPAPAQNPIANMVMPNALAWNPTTAMIAAAAQHTSAASAIFSANNEILQNNATAAAAAQQARQLTAAAALQFPQLFSSSTAATQSSNVVNNYSQQLQLLAQVQQQQVFTVKQNFPITVALFKQDDWVQLLNGFRNSTHNMSVINNCLKNDVSGTMLGQPGQNQLPLNSERYLDR